ncbi:DUF1622 domain-containing protein [Gordonia sp. VNK21]|uniref:DUF1622 domain-containing protein n=1 Tax=Gordonia sp. VNK21 TaxID=3382483 RepID=UPI0038D4AEA4
MEDVFGWVALGFEVLGALCMVLGTLLALGLAVRALRRGHPGADVFQSLRRTLGGAIMLGLEVLIAADLVRTITSKPSLEDVAVLGIVVLIRTVLSLSISVEIEGVLPWRRALLTSGASVIAAEAGRDRAAAARVPGGPTGESVPQPSQ